MDPSMSQPIHVDLPERATIFELAMTSPEEGWLVGAVWDPDYRTIEAGLMLHYHNRAWRLVEDPLPIAFLDSISMVSPDEGWVTGYHQNKRESYLLHYTDGHWRQVAVPFQPTDGKYYSGIRMRSPDEGWIMVCPESTWRGQIESLLLHYRGGVWTPVTVPTPLVCDFVPVGPGDLWLIGNSSVRLSYYPDSLLAHYQQGQWSITPSPVPAWLSTLHMRSATAGYAVGWQPPDRSPNRSDLPPAVVLAYEGTTWQPIQTGADPAAQVIMIFDDQQDG